MFTGGDFTQILREGGVPVRYRAARLAGAPAPWVAPADAAGAAAHRAAQDALLAALADLTRPDGPAGCVMALCGPRRVGKTWLACGLLVEAAVARRSMRYAKLMDYFLDIRATYDGGGRRERDVVAAWVRPAVLVLDECAERAETAWEQRQLTLLIDKRYDAETLTVLLTNDTPERAAAALGDSVASRLEEAGAWVECAWPARPAGWKGAADAR